MKPLFLYILVGTLFFSCNKKKSCYRDFNNEDLSQLVYSANDTLIFKLISGSTTDTLTSAGIATTTTPNFNSYECSEDRTEKSIGFTSSHYYDPGYALGQYTGLSVTLYQPFKNASTIVPRIDIGIKFFNWESPKMMIINSKSVPDVYGIKSPNPSFHISKIYWSFTYGMIRIEHTNGEVWERINF